MRPIIREIPYPDDPFASFCALARLRAPFFLDSALVDGRSGRWSFMGAEPFALLESKGARLRVSGLRADGDRRSPFAALKTLLSRFPLAREPGDPPFLGGAVGYFGYDLRHFVERVPHGCADDAAVPDCRLGFYDAIVALDHRQRRAYAIAAPVFEKQHEEAVQRVQRMAALISRPSAGVLSPPSRGGPRAALAAHPVPGCWDLYSNFTRDGYLEAVGRAKEYIAAGDIYQVNLSHRLTAPVRCGALDLYGHLRAINPAPFAAYLDCGDFAVLSASPERFLRARGAQVETRPIKGTRPRGATPPEDERLARELLTSEKDRAENVMIVDLERNDLGRTCAYGSVHVTELCALEKYETVFHLVSTVVGRLHKEFTAVDCLKACFPGGSITGAPKVRSMEIIDELEPTCRGIYTGAIGYVCFSGDMDTSIVIRTLVVKDGWAHFQVGGGIVADSEPAAEYQETLDKARALITAVARPMGMVRA
ncbi:MAG TPA: aminodeoxychorismate synthase component I [Armatimonadota bacterium]|nr:aminodeoxychorismate synthase component I [Armatimonadota bacterium]